MFNFSQKFTNLLNLQEIKEGAAPRMAEEMRITAEALKFSSFTTFRIHSQINFRIAQQLGIVEEIKQAFKQ